MKKLVILVMALAFLAACGDSIKSEGNHASEPNQEITPQACARATVGYGYTTKGTDVKYAQEQLLARGNATVRNYITSSGGADGHFGSGTYNAVRAYQRQVNYTLRRFGEPLIDIDGVIGQATWPWLGCGAVGNPSNGTIRFPSGLKLPITTNQPEGFKETYYDPNNTGNPLLDVRGKGEEKLSANFKIKELAQDTIQATGRKTSFNYIRLEPKLVQCLQGIRNATGSVTVTSGYRSYKYSQEISSTPGSTASPTSRHISGQAADIKISGYTPAAVAKKAIDVCGCKLGLGIGGSQTHIDVRGWSHIYKYASASSSALNDVKQHHTNKCS